jgi:cytoskeletal protein RodZ
MPASDGHEPKSQDGDSDERDRRIANIFLLIAAVVLIGAGIWLVDAMIAAKKADECISAGRRNCAPIDLPVRER